MCRALMWRLPDVMYATSIGDSCKPLRRSATREETEAVSDQMRILQEMKIKRGNMQREIQLTVLDWNLPEMEAQADGLKGL